MKIIFASVVALLAVALPGAAKGGPMQSLIVSKAGSGSGTVSSSPAGINCGSTCSASFKRNSDVALTATPASGSTFASWSGDCSGSSCTVRMSVDRSVTATFNISSPACSDGVDNDSDGRADYPVDGGCANTSDTSETNLASGPEDTSGVPSGYAFCAWEGTTCSISSSKNVIYGAHGTYSSPVTKSSDFFCDNSVFGDPQPGQEKACFIHDTTSPPSVIKEGIFCTGDCATRISHPNSVATIAIGGYYNIASTWTSDTIKYAEVQNCYSSDDIQPDPNTCRANGWLVHDANGQEIHSPDNFTYLVNMGNVAFQDYFKQRILDLFTAQPWIDGVYFDGFFMDVCDWGASYPIYASTPGGGQGPLLWANDTDLQASMVSFISNISSAVRASGHQVGVNARGFDCGNNDTNNGGATIRWHDQIHSYVDFAYIEEFEQLEGPGDPSCGTTAHPLMLEGNNTWCRTWDGWQDVLAHDVAMGLDVAPADYFNATGEASECRYLRGSTLLETDGTNGTFWFGGWGAWDVWYPGCTDFNPGNPIGSKTIVSTSSCGIQTDCHAYRRDFQFGYVIVNPTWVTVTVGSDTIPSGDAVLHQN